MTTDDLGISVTEHEDVRVIALTGELDSYTASSISEHVEGWVSGVRSLVVNMDELSYIDSAGLSVVVGLWVKAIETGVGVRIICNNRRIRRVLEITGLLDLFNMDSTSPEAQELTESSYERVVAIHEQISAKGIGADSQ